MYHSIGFIIDGKQCDTWSTWHLVPETRPVINPPEVKTQYVDIPGADGSLDFTEALTGGIKYKNREGEWVFYAHHDYYDNWIDVYKTLLKVLHGRYFKVGIALEDDPMYGYSGRIFVDSWQSPKDWSKVTLKYNLHPFASYTDAFNFDNKPWIPGGGGEGGGGGGIIPTPPVVDEELTNADWRWDSLWNHTITYGRFEVKGEMPRTLVNNLKTPVSIATNATNALTAILPGGTIVEIPDGVTTADESRLIIPPGTSEVTFKGYGIITLSYNLGDSL